MNFDMIRTETLKAYLFAIARNTYLESLRKRHHHDHLTETQHAIQPGMERVLEDQNELDHVRKWLQTLPEVDRSAFVLRIQHDLPYAEVARILYISKSAVKVKVHRMRKKLFSDYQERNSHE